MNLSDESKAILAELIVEYLEMHVSAELERGHLDTVKRRRHEVRNGQVAAVDGEAISAMARRVINKYEMG